MLLVFLAQVQTVVENVIIVGTVKSNVVLGPTLFFVHDPETCIWFLVDTGSKYVVFFLVGVQLQIRLELNGSWLQLVIEFLPSSRSLSYDKSQFGSKIYFAVFES